MIEIDQKLFITSLNEVSATATDAGKIVIACLKDSCKWDATYLASDNPQVTQFYAAQRGIYGALRKLIKIEHLKEIEFNYKRKPDDNGTPDTRRKSIDRTDKRK